MRIASRVGRRAARGRRRTADAARRGPRHDAPWASLLLGRREVVVGGGAWGRDPDQQRHAEAQRLAGAGLAGLADEMPALQGLWDAPAPGWGRRR